MPLTSRTYSGGPGSGYGAALTRDQTRGVFGQVMGLVALTFGFLALGAYVTRNIAGGSGILFILLGFGCVIGLQAASNRGHDQLAIGLLFGLGLCFGLAFGPIFTYYAHSDPSAITEAAGATAGFVGILGSAGWATRTDLSVYLRTFFWALMGLILFGLVAMFVAIPGANLIYCIVGLVIFGFFTAFDFQRLRNSSMGSAVPIAARIFLDIFNVFILLLSLFGGGGSRRR